jgi:NAD dependent epimerase/dehydratase family enzyme
MSQLQQPHLPELPVTRPLRIVLPGGSGQVGQMLARRFQQRGHHVTVLTRSPYSAPWQTIHWDARHTDSWTESLEGADVCINLTGRSINCRPTLANRRAIYESRIGPTLLLHGVIASLAHPPRLWMNASAATIYGRALGPKGTGKRRVDLPLDESSPIEADPEHGDLLGAGAPQSWSRARGFTQRVVRDWEAAFFSVPTPRTRKIALRSAVTLSPVAGNVFAVLANLVRFSLGGTQGSGRQFFPWIHEADYADAVEFLIAREDLDGPFNLAAPEPLPNREFMALLREALNMPNGLPAPAPFIYLGALLMGSNPELVLSSCRAVPGRLLAAGFRFSFPGWEEAAEDLAHQWRHRFD